MDFEAVVALHYEDLYRFALGLTRHPGDACDLTQQTYAIYAQKRGQVRDHAQIRHWLFTTLYREFLRLREQGRRTVSLDDTSVSWPEPTAPRAAEHQDVLDALARLELPHREVLTLFYLRQHAYHDIAAILGIPIGTVMSRLSRAKDALRAALDPQAHPHTARIIPLPRNPANEQRHG
jgi:RNA polymerase sigma-70 factor (ECF subfamily)